MKWSTELLFGCTWVKGEWCGGGVVKGGGQGKAFYRPELSGSRGGTGVVSACRGRHGDVRGRRRAGQGRHGRGARESRGAWSVLWWSGAPRAGVCRPGWLRTVRARKLLDRVSADRTPASAGRGRGLVRWGCHGELQGGHRQAPGHAGSLLCCWLVASGHGGGCHAMAALGLGFRVWGEWGVSRGCRRHWVRCWTCWSSKWTSRWCGI